MAGFSDKTSQKLKKKTLQKYFDRKFDPLFVQAFDKRFSYSPLILAPKSLPTSKGKSYLWLLLMDSFFDMGWTTHHTLAIRVVEFSNGGVQN